MCVDIYHAPPSRLRRFGSALYFVALVAAILAACFVLAPDAPPVDPLMRTVW